ncbi:glycosyltransferase family 4 protein [Roseiconus lacunae]|uniref:Glycosyltransferase family 1 protein n=1 Tax=Roseiconus lacunae TaxID=2605694 RepID=A0ABT7PR45_9BACT|nr:glycosyltransferase family 1 protein [Roseiconus lacunae]MDM4018936.1 glycosyltransferase family 1 protein [Roseiconus lacunae]WRQ51841.1 glycosyltransferase family 1 protein [Stieleria sp. HD01]
MEEQPKRHPQEVILIGNYPLDRQESMERFAVLLHRELTDRGIEVKHWRPIAVLGRVATSTTSGYGKWLGYFDKWLFFPLVLFLRRWFHPQAHFHVCDHSNAPYLRSLPSKHSSITCHDVLAVRAAEGFTDTYCQTSSVGRFLQRWIKKHLLQADRLVAVSNQTMSHLHEFEPTSNTERWRVIHLALNNNFHPVSQTQQRQLLAPYGLGGDRSSFIMHLGSSLQRKNREMLIDMVSHLGETWGGKICFAGAPVETALRERARELGVEDRIVEITKPSHDVLLALYSSCDAFVFPSFSEGFGWPVIEAQACGAPVISSDVAPMPEVSGGTALHASPTDAEAFAEHLLSLQDRDVRHRVVEEGFENVKRFAPKVMIDAYVQMMAD